MLKPQRYQAMVVKVRTILSAAHRSGCEALVLTAFGCGAFSNPPEDMAQIFRHLIAQQFRRAFKHISFSIREDRKHSWYAPDGKLQPFTAAFEALDKEEYRALRCAQGLSDEESVDPAAAASTSTRAIPPGVSTPADHAEAASPEGGPEQPGRSGETRRRRSYHRSKAARKEGRRGFYDR